MDEKIFCPVCHHQTSAGRCDECGSSTVLQERFVLQKMLGHGAQGFTWLAQEQATSEIYAIKELSFRRLDTFKSLDLFQREVSVLKSLDHPAIPTYVEDFHVEDARHISVYLVQEYIDGEALKTEARSQDVVVELLKAMLQILEYLHSLKPPVIHRDIKPSNIMRRADGSYVLIDFGSTKAALDSSLGGSTVAGTIGFMAPEQLRGQASPASDIYGLGATIISLITGSSDAVDVANPTAWQKKVKIDSGLKKILASMVELDVNNRAQSASELLKAVSNWEHKEEASSTMMALWNASKLKRKETKVLPNTRSGAGMSAQFDAKANLPWSRLESFLSFHARDALAASFVGGMLISFVMMLLLLVRLAMLGVLRTLGFESSGAAWPAHYLFLVFLLPVVGHSVFTLFAPLIYVKFRKYAHKRWPDFYTELDKDALAFLTHRRWISLRLVFQLMFLPTMTGWFMAAVGSVVIVFAVYHLLFTALPLILGPPVFEPRQTLFFTRHIVGLFAFSRLVAHLHIPVRFYFSGAGLGLNGLGQVHRAAATLAAGEDLHGSFFIKSFARHTSTDHPDIQSATLAMNILQQLNSRDSSHVYPVLDRKGPYRTSFARITRLVATIAESTPTYKKVRLLKFLSSFGGLNEGLTIFKEAETMRLFLDSQRFFGPFTRPQLMTIVRFFVVMTVLVALAHMYTL